MRFVGRMFNEAKPRHRSVSRVGVVVLYMHFRPDVGSNDSDDPVGQFFGFGRITVIQKCVENKIVTGNRRRPCQFVAVMFFSSLYRGGCPSGIAEILALGPIANKCMRAPECSGSKDSSQYAAWLVRRVQVSDTLRAWNARRNGQTPVSPANPPSPGQRSVAPCECPRSHSSRVPRTKACR